jgi:hypothetical protein
VSLTALTQRVHSDGAIPPERNIFLLMLLAVRLKWSQKSMVDLRYLRTHLAVVGWLVKGRELTQQSAATANEISGRVASATYINELTIAW